MKKEKLLIAVTAFVLATGFKGVDCRDNGSFLILTDSRTIIRNCEVEFHNELGDELGPKPVMMFLEGGAQYVIRDAATIERALTFYERKPQLKAAHRELKGNLKELRRETRQLQREVRAVERRIARETQQASLERERAELEKQLEVKERELAERERVVEQAHEKLQRELERIEREAEVNMKELIRTAIRSGTATLVK